LHRHQAAVPILKREEKPSEIRKQKEHPSESGERDGRSQYKRTHSRDNGRRPLNIFNVCIHVLRISKSQAIQDRKLLLLGLLRALE
jgi:hypothetical protein